ncbi:unnamed protein product [Ilex paraguariensis]|uniref:Cation/H(+) antiporter C-terminal domain-containing protein n=1 Tax=Ilex paraguariensis TaxID=185542 RepID=A0ABC8URP6_9AQUA
MTLRTVATGIAMALVIFLLVRPVVLWRLQIQAEEELKPGFIYLIFVGVLVTGFCCQASGLHIFYVPLLYGMAILAGPPFGISAGREALIWMFMPLFFLKNGLVIDIFGQDEKLYVRRRDAISLGLVMNIQEALELGMFKMMKQAKAIDNEAVVVLRTSMLIVTVAITPMVRYLHDPSRRFTANGTIESNRKEVRIVNSMILNRAPCSIAIIVDWGLLNSSRSVLATWISYRVAVLFLGGADDREALVLGARMAGQPYVNLTITRLLQNGNVIGEDASERT